MATRLKTVLWSFPVLASITNNVLTNVPQTTIFLPENAKSFKTVKALVSMDDVITVTGGTITTKTVGLRLGAAAFTSVANANALTNSGENLSLFWEQDFTSHFTTNWSGTSMTCDFQLQINQSTGTGVGMVNICVTLKITYEYDDASATHIKTVMWPLNAPGNAVPIAATTYDTIPAWDTELPEASKVYRNIHLVVQGNEARAGAVTDHVITVNVGAATITSGVYEGSLASDRFFRYVWDLTSTYPGTAATQAFQLASSVARNNHLQAWIVVTYEFNPATSTRIMNSLKLPMDLTSPMGGTAATDYQRGTRNLRIAEPGVITTRSCAFFSFWNQIAAVAGLNMRVGTGAFVGYTDNSATLCGSNAAMTRNDTAFTLQRGQNTLNFDVYRTDTADLGWNISGFWLVNYTSDKASQGVGAHNHTVLLSINSCGTVGAYQNTVQTVTPAIPEANFMTVALGLEGFIFTANTIVLGGIAVSVERLAAEGGVEWEPAYIDAAQNDGEVGAYFYYAQVRDIFKRWPGDAESSRLELETARRWRSAYSAGAAAATLWDSVDLTLTYHSITFTVAGNITNSAGGTVTINLCEAATGDRLLSTSRIGNGAYSFTWYDNVIPLFTEARESSTLLGRSDNGVAA